MPINIYEIIKYPLSKKFFRYMILLFLVLEIVVFFIPKMDNALSVLGVFERALAVAVFRFYLQLDDGDMDDIKNKEIGKYFYKYLMKTIPRDLLWLIILIFSAIFVIVCAQVLHFDLISFLKFWAGSKILIFLSIFVISTILSVFDIGLFFSFSVETKFWNWFNFKRMFLVWQNFPVSTILLSLINSILLVTAIYTGKLFFVIFIMYKYFIFCKAVILAQLYKHKPIF